MEACQEHLSAEETAFFDAKTASEASVERMVTSAAAPAQPGTLTRITAEDFNTLPVDAANIKGTLPPIAGVEPFAPFDFYIFRKIYMHNMSHAMTAYLGYLRGHHLLCDAAADPLIRVAALRALGETAGALEAEFGPAAAGMGAYAANLMTRYENRLLGDTVLRVGRARKQVVTFGPSHRRAVLYHRAWRRGLYISAIAAALFAPVDDTASAEVARTAAQRRPGGA